MSKVGQSQFYELLENEWRSKFISILGEKRANSFVNNLISIVTDGNLLQCDPASILRASMVSVELNLPLVKDLGMCAIVPYFSKGVYLAQLQIGYLGYTQLAIRSGQIRTLTVAVLGRSQFKGFDPILNKLDYDFKDTSDLTPFAYVGYLELINGFTKLEVWSHQKMEKHRQEYSKNSPIWKNNFEAMAKKTVIKFLLKKNAPLVSELNLAIKADQATVSEKGEFEYIDNPKSEIATTSVIKNQASSEVKTIFKPKTEDIPLTEEPMGDKS